MRKHPFYLYVCFCVLAIVGYSNLRGWNPGDFIALTVSRTAFGPVFFHK